MSSTLTELKKIKELFNGKGVYREKGTALALQIVEGLKKGKMSKEAYQALKLFLKYNTFWVTQDDLVFSPGTPQRLKEVYITQENKKVFLERLYSQLVKYFQRRQL